MTPLQQIGNGFLGMIAIFLTLLFLYLVIRYLIIRPAKEISQEGVVPS